MFRVFVFLITDVYIYSIIFIICFSIEWLARNHSYLSKYYTFLKLQPIYKFARILHIKCFFFHETKILNEKNITCF